MTTGDRPECVSALSSRYKFVVKFVSLDVITNQAPNSLQIESCDVISRHVFEPIAVVASIKRHYDHSLNIIQTIV